MSLPSPRTARVRPGLLLASLAASVSAAGAPSVLRFGWKPGLESKYRLVVDGRTTVTLGGRTDQTEMHSRLHLTQRVLAVKADGSARILTRIESGKTRRGRDRAQVMPPREGTMRMSARGVLLDGSALTAGSSALQLIFPEGPIEVGSRWFNSLPPSDELPVPIHVRYTVLGLVRREGENCAQIAVQIASSKSSAVEAPMRVEFEANGEMIFSLDRGVLLLSEVDSDLLMRWTQPGPDGPRPVATRTSFDMRLELRR